MSGSPTSQNESNSWLYKLSHLLFREPKDIDQLFDLLRKSEQRNLLNSDALHMIEGVLQVSETQVRDIMIPRSHMAVVDIDLPLEEFLPMVIETGHSRFPVVAENRDEVLGILFAKDLLSYTFNTRDNSSFNLKDFLRPMIIVPESKRTDALLKEFRSNRNHMAIVVDEYGGVSGLVTIEDVLEQIVGDIEDEHDIAEDAHIKQTDDAKYTIKALTPIEEFNEYFAEDLSDEEFDTIGGLVANNMGHLPKVGESIQIENYTFKVLSADNRRIELFETVKSS